MNFIHEDPEFDDLLQIVAEARKLSKGLIEKDYWVTHTLWALHAAGFEVWFKGGTSLSKGFALIERFSEDLDLKLESGRVSALTQVSNWKSEGANATAERKRYFETLVEVLVVPGCQVALDPDSVDKSWRGADLHVRYPGRHLEDLHPSMSPFVRLEVGSARVTPFVACDLTSFVHAQLSDQGQLGSFDATRPRGVRCVHPLVTLLEKLDALQRRFPNDSVAPATFVRHFEDAAHVIAAADRLPVLSDYADVRALAAEMLDQRQIARLPSPSDPAFTPGQGFRWDAVRDAHAAINQMFWGPRVPLEEACNGIRQWIEATLNREDR